MLFSHSTQLRLQKTVNYIWEQNIKSKYTEFNAKISWFIWHIVKKPYVSAHLERLATLNIAYWPKCCLGLGQRAKFTRSSVEVSDYRPVCNFRPLGYPTVRISRWYYSLLVCYINSYVWKTYVGSFDLKFAIHWEIISSFVFNWKLGIRSLTTREETEYYLHIILFIKSRSL